MTLWENARLVLCGVVLLGVSTDYHKGGEQRPAGKQALFNISAVKGLTVESVILDSKYDSAVVVYRIVLRSNDKSAHQLLSELRRDFAGSRARKMASAHFAYSFSTRQGPIRLDCDVALTTGGIGRESTVRFSKDGHGIPRIFLACFVPK